MKSATLPPLHVDPELRADIEHVLEEGETISGFMEAPVRTLIAHRRSRRASIERGLASHERARERDEYFGAKEVLDDLRQRLEDAKRESGEA